MLHKRFFVMDKGFKDYKKVRKFLQEPLTKVLWETKTGSSMPSL